jgi:serine/threonine protein kinase
MATPTASVRDYCTLIAKSKLLPADEVEGLLKRWREEMRGAEDQVDQFRKFLTSRRYLTEWQAQMVQRGRADGFFIGGYKILDRIGKGQMGGVYKAVHSLGQIVALKILPASKAKSQHVLGRFQREARLLTQLDHPNVVRAYEVGEANGVHYIGMEFLEGETLDEVLTRRKRLPWAEAVRLVHQALGGLQHLHEKRMIHRDVKPANMMLTPAATKPDTTWDATLKVLDIGLGRELFAEDTPEGQIETQLTVEGAVVGTPDYLAPEQAKDARSADIRADIYSLGCVLYHCLAGGPPFPAANIMTQMVMHATEKPPPIASTVADAPPGLQAVLDGMMAKSPADRYQTPAQAAAALAPLLRPGGSAPAPSAMVPAF